MIERRGSRWREREMGKTFAGKGRIEKVCVCV